MNVKQMLIEGLLEAIPNDARNISLSISYFSEVAPQAGMVNGLYIESAHTSFMEPRYVGGTPDRFNTIDGKV